jgi:hypothetical protein
MRIHTDIHNKSCAAQLSEKNINIGGKKEKVVARKQHQAKISCRTETTDAEAGLRMISDNKNLPTTEQRMLAIGRSLKLLHRNLKH